jgi:hypothetical protein
LLKQFIRNCPNPYPGDYCQDDGTTDGEYHDSANDAERAAQAQIPEDLSDLRS